jgi:hypothetical protein
MIENNIRQINGGEKKQQKKSLPLLNSPYFWVGKRTSLVVHTLMRNTI